MSDEADIAAELEAAAINAALQYRKPEAPKVQGICLYCDEEIAQDRRWCDAECARLWERYQ